MNEQELIHRLIDIFRFKEEYHLQTSKLHAQDLYVLERLYLTGPVQVMDFAQRYKLAPSTLTGILDRLAKKGLITRERGLENRKLVELHLTTEGRQMVEMHFAEDEAFAQNFFAGLPAGKQTEFKILLAELLQSIDLYKLFRD